MTHVTIEELSFELSETLPAREALGLFNYANVVASNSSMALNALTVNSVAVSGATQTIGAYAPGFASSVVARLATGQGCG